MKVRLLAYETLNAIYKNKSFSNLAINETLKTSALTDVDKRLYTNIVYGVLENDLLLETIVKSYVRGKRLDPAMKTILKATYYQLYFLDKIPAYAAVDEAVEIMKKDKGIVAAKFANAVLREMTRRKYDLKKEDYADEDEYNALKYSIPLWLYKMIKKHRGEEAVLNWARASKVPAPLYARVNTLLATKEEVLKNKDFVIVPELENALIYKGKISIVETEEYRKGFIVVQDISAQKVAPYLEAKPTDKIIDLCAAPGSKSTHLAAILRNEGHIIANDLYAKRVAVIEASLKRLGIKNATCSTRDVFDLPRVYGAKSFDKILLDAPCSGLGVIRRKPDILLNYRDADNKNLDELIALQRKALDVAYYLLKEGGILVYSTCTIDKKEDEYQISDFLKRHPDMELLEEKLILPSIDTGDGFYIAKTTRRAV